MRFCSKIDDGVERFARYPLIKDALHDCSIFDIRMDKRENRIWNVGDVLTAASIRQRIDYNGPMPVAFEAMAKV